MSTTHPFNSGAGLADATAFHAFLRTTPLATIRWDHGGHIRSWNPAAERIFGWKVNEALGKSLPDLLTSDTDREQITGVISTLLSGQSVNGRLMNVTKGGDQITCEWHHAVLQDDTGQVIGGISQAEDITVRLREQQEQREQEALLMAVLDNCPSAIHVKDLQGRYILINRLFGELLGVTNAELRGKTDDHLLPPETAEQMREHDREIVKAGKLIEREIDVLEQYGDRAYIEVKFPLFDEHGAINGTCGISTEITERKRAEQEHLALQEQVIIAQQAVLRELSTPLIPLADQVVVLPLVGSIDSARAQQVIETLLAGVMENQAQVAILDITGVPVVDTQVANALLRAAHAVKLLGAQVVLTGIRPEVAQTLVGLGVDLQGIVTRASLQSGIAYALTGRKNRW